MKLIKTEDAVGHVLCHDITQIIRGVTILVVFCPCALVLVSHDERFLDALTATRWMFDVDCAEGGGLGDTHVRVKL